MVFAADDPRPSVYDGTAPLLTMQPLEFVLGASLDQAGPSNTDCSGRPWNLEVPLQLRWVGSDAVSAVRGFDVWQQYPDYVWKRAEGTSATTYQFAGTNYDGSCGDGGSVESWYWVVAHDNRGNSATSAGQSRVVDVWQETGLTEYGQAGIPLVRTGTWSTSSCVCSNNGRTLTRSSAGASLTYTITTTKPGAVVAIAVGKNTNRGVMNVSLDGGTATSVNTYASAPTHRVVVWQRVINSPGTHTVKVTNAGTAGRPRIDIDAVLLTSGRWQTTPDADDYAFLE